LRLILVILLILVLLTTGLASADVVDNVLNKAKEVGYSAGNSKVLVMTNLEYSSSSIKYMDEFIKKSKVLFSKNIIFVHSAYYKPLWFAFFNKTTGECIYIEIRNNSIYKISKENINAENLFSNPKVWDKKMKKKIFDGNEFSIITIANVWAEGCPYELLKCAEFHNHICPGLISGYLIAEYLEKNLPLKKGEYYQILAIPPWCKDDAFQVLFDSTVGKRRMYVKQIDVNTLPKNLENIAGIYIAWNRSAGKGRAVLLAFNWSKACKMAGINKSDFKRFSSYYWWYSRLKLDLFLIKHLSKPEIFVRSIKNFEINYTTLQEINTAGVNPLAKLGFINYKCTNNSKSALLVDYQLEIAAIVMISLLIILIIFRFKNFK